MQGEAASHTRIHTHIHKHARCTTKTFCECAHSQNAAHMTSKARVVRRGEKRRSSFLSECSSSTLLGFHASAVNLNCELNLEKERESRGGERENRVA